MVDQTFTANAYIVEVDYNRLPSIDELSEYSIRNHLSKRLPAFNLHIPIYPSNEGWPDYETVERPSVMLWVGDISDEGMELGSSGERYVVNAHIFANNDAERARIGSVLKDIFRRTIPIYNYVTGNEVDPDPTGEYFRTDDVGWQRIPHIYNAPDAERWRAVATAVLVRVS
jgi:hypothetical protein